MKTILTQEQMRLELCEFLKDCETETFMKVVRICFREFGPKCIKDKDDRGFSKIEIDW